MAHADSLEGSIRKNQYRIIKETNMLETFSKTDVGKKRTVNQDYIFVSNSQIGNLPNLLLLADGMGGEKAGDYASKFAVESIKNEVVVGTQETTVKLLTSAISYANEQLYQKSENEFDFRGMGTTLVAATCYNNQLIVANVGDSRLYLVRNDVMVQVTKDHSFAEEIANMANVVLSEEAIKQNKNYITRAVGAEEKVKIDFFQVEIKEDDMILLCSDGLTNMLTDEEILLIVYGEKDLELICEALIKKANDRGGKDNISVIIACPLDKKEEEYHD